MSNDWPGGGLDESPTGQGTNDQGQNLYGRSGLNQEHDHRCNCQSYAQGIPAELPCHARHRQYHDGDRHDLQTVNPTCVSNIKPIDDQRKEGHEDE